MDKLRTSLAHASGYATTRAQARTLGALPNEIALMQAVIDAER